MNSKNKLIYLRYIYPTVAAVFAIALIFIPCYKFVTASGENDAVSVARLMSNSWTWATECLWGTGIEQTAGNIYFSQTVIALIAIFSVLFVLGTAVSVYLTVSAFLCFSGKKIGEKNRIILITFLFNRTVVSVIQALPLLLLAYPRILPYIYRSTLNIQVEMRLLFIDPLLIQILILVLGTVLSVFSKKREIALGMDIFAAPQATFENTEADASQISVPESEYDKMNREAKEEQVERLLDMLNKKK